MEMLSIWIIIAVFDSRKYWSIIMLVTWLFPNVNKLCIENKDYKRYINTAANKRWLRALFSFYCSRQPEMRYNSINKRVCTVWVWVWKHVQNPSDFNFLTTFLQFNKPKKFNMHQFSDCKNRNYWDYNSKLMGTRNKLCLYTQNVCFKKFQLILKLLLLIAVRIGLLES